MMGYPPQQGPWGQQPPQGQPYGQQPPQQGGYAPDPFGQGQPGGYAPQGQGGYDFGQLYGRADMSSNLLDKGPYDAIVESASWDRTKDGTKSAWTIVFRTTNGMHPDTKLTMTLSVSPTKNDGSENNQGMGIMFRQLGAMGIPIPPNQPFWELGWSPEQVAQAMTGRPVMLSVIQDEYDGVTRNKVRDIRPPRPGAATQRVQTGQAQGQTQYGSPPQPTAPGPGPQNPGWQPQQPGQAPQPWQQPQAPQGQQPPPQQQGQWYGPQGQPQGDYQQLPGGQQATQWSQQPPQQGPPPGYNPAVPGYAQPAQPGQPGYGQFTQQGQAVQPGTQPPPQGNGYPQQPQQPGQPGPDGTPAPPPWAQQLQTCPAPLYLAFTNTTQPDRAMCGQGVGEPGTWRSSRRFSCGGWASGGPPKNL